MPKALGGRSFSSVPIPTRTSRRNRMKQLEYDNYLLVLNEHEVGELELEEGDNSRSVRVSLKKAAERAGFELDTWEANGHVYFRKSTMRPKKGRPRSMIDIRRAEGRNTLNEEDQEDEVEV